MKNNKLTDVALNSDWGSTVGQCSAVDIPQAKRRRTTTGKNGIQLMV